MRDTWCAVGLLINEIRARVECDTGGNYGSNRLCTQVQIRHPTQTLLPEEHSRTRNSICHPRTVRVSACRERSHRPRRCFQRQWRAETAYHISHHALHNLARDAIGRFSSQQNRGPLATLGSVSRLAQCARDEEVH